MGEAVLGILTNPMSGRDIRRLVAKASVFPTVEKANMVARMLTAAGVVGVDRVLLSTDVGGVSSAVLRALQAHRAAVSRATPDRAGREPRWPEVEFVGPPHHTQTAADSTETIRRMIDAGARVIVCLGGDGTARVSAAAVGEVPMLPISTGTNNAFPRIREATVAGLAAALVAVEAVSVELGTRRSTMLVVQAAGRTENALVDVCVTRSPDIGSRALWDPAGLTELYCTFAEPDGIGLSSIAGQLCPSPRELPTGVAVLLGPVPETSTAVLAPIAPGLVLPVGVRSFRVLEVGETVTVETPHGTVAVDGEREIEFCGTDPPTVRLTADGPRCVDVTAVLTEAARTGLLVQRQHDRPRPPP